MFGGAAISNPLTPKYASRITGSVFPHFTRCRSFIVRLRYSAIPPSHEKEVPRFDGSDPTGWIFRVQEFYDFHSTPHHLRLRIVSFYMEGKAATCYQWIKANSFLTSLREFLVNLKHRFGISIYEDHQGNLSKLTQTAPVAEFQSAFKELMNKITRISEPLLFSFFITETNNSWRATVF